MADDSFTESVMTRTHPLEHLEAVLVVGIGGFAGSNLRYFVELSIPHTLSVTAIVNTLGCLAIGFFVYEELFSNTISTASRTLMATGFIASFTTYSTFIIDTITTTSMTGIVYVLGSYGIGFGAVIIGREAARWAHSQAPSLPEISK